MGKTGQRVKTSLKMAGLLVAANGIGLMLLLVVYLIPQDWLRFNTETTIGILLHEGGGWTALEDMPETEEDFFTDAIMVNTCYTAEGSLLDQALLSQSYWDGLPAEEFVDYFYADAQIRAEMGLRNYARYWHGYQIFLRPLLTHFHINQIRLLAMMLEIALGVAILYLLIATQQEKLIPPVTALCILLVPITTLINLNYMACAFTTELAMLCLLFQKRREADIDHIILFLMELDGIMIGYFDLLTYPCVSFGVPMILFFCLDAEQRCGWKKRFCQFIKSGIAWVTGYGGMLLGKWTLATLLTKENVIADGIDAVMRRSSDSWNDEKVTYLEVLQKNFSYYNTAVYKMLLIVLVLFLLAFLFRGYRFHPKGEICMSLGLCALIPFVWYFFTRNHSIIHSYFTFRDFSVLLFAIYTFLYGMLEKVGRTS